jgi:hypothetical protein
MRTLPPAAQPPGKQEQSGDTGKSQPRLPASSVTSRKSNDAADKESSDQEAGTYSHAEPEPVLCGDAAPPWFHCHRHDHLPLTEQPKRPREQPKKLQKVRVDRNCLTLIPAGTSGSRMDGYALMAACPMAWDRCRKRVLTIPLTKRHRLPSDSALKPLSCAL